MLARGPLKNFSAPHPSPPPPLNIVPSALRWRLSLMSWCCRLQSLFSVCVYILSHELQWEIYATRTSQFRPSIISNGILFVTIGQPWPTDVCLFSLVQLTASQPTLAKISARRIGRGQHIGRKFLHILRSGVGGGVERWWRGKLGQENNEFCPW